MHVNIIYKHWPEAKLTEENCCFVDFLNTLIDDRFTHIDTFAFIHESDVFNTDEKLTGSLSVVALYDDTDVELLRRIVSKIEGSVLFYQPTMIYLPNRKLEAYITSNHYLLTNNDSFITNYEKVFYTDSISKSYFEKDDTHDLFDVQSVVVLDLLNDPESLHSPLSTTEVLPFLNGKRSRKIEGLSDMAILSNLGISSLKIPPKSLSENYLQLCGICWNDNRPEYYCKEGVEFIYPSTKSKAFGRWADIAQCHGMSVRSDHVHGYQLLKNSIALEAVVDSLYEMFSSHDSN